MKRLISILKDRRTQYCIIVWILLLKVIDIVTSLVSEVPTLEFLAMLGFQSLPMSSRLAWDGLVVSTVLWLCYRVWKDTFGFVVSIRPLSKLRLFSLLMLTIWIFLASITALQFAALAIAPTADPKIEVSTYYTPVYSTESSEQIENSTGDIQLDSWERTDVALDLSRSVFTDPLSVYETGETTQGGTSYVGASYYCVKDSPIGQKMIEMKFCGNGADKVGGWFAYRVQLENYIPVSENSTLLLLLRLSPSSDGTAWTWYRIDFSTEENDTYSLVWSFYDVPANYVHKHKNGTIFYYHIGSVVNWKFFQFNLHDVSYTSFSKKPSHITGVRYALGAECDNDVKAEFLLAKISPQPFKVNSIRIKNVKPTVAPENSGAIVLEGLHFNKVLVASEVPLEKTDVNYQLELLGMSRTEAYGWSLGGISNATQFNAELNFNAASQASEFFLMDEEITSQVPQRGIHSVELKLDYEEITLVVVSDSKSYFLPLVVLMPLMIVLVYFLSKITKAL